MLSSLLRPSVRMCWKRNCITDLSLGTKAEQQVKKEEVEAAAAAGHDDDDEKNRIRIKTNCWNGAPKTSIFSSVCLAPEKHFPSENRFGYYPFIFFACRSWVPAPATLRRLSFIIFGTGVCVRRPLSCNNRPGDRAARTRALDTWYLAQLRVILTNVEQRRTLTRSVAITWYDIYCLPLCSHTWWACKHKPTENSNSTV